MFLLFTPAVFCGSSCSLLVVFWNWKTSCMENHSRYLLPVHHVQENRCLEGLAIDDTTFQKCAHGVPRVWPNTEDWLSNCQSSGASALPDASNFVTSFFSLDFLYSWAWSQLFSPEFMMIYVRDSPQEQTSPRNWVSRLPKSSASGLGLGHDSKIGTTEIGTSSKFEDGKSCLL